MLYIAIPMAGKGSRFVGSEYSLPKPLIPIHGVPMIELVVRNIRPRCPHRFIFLALADHLEQTNLRMVVEAVAPGGLIVPVPNVTEGALCTILFARDIIDNDDQLMIANSDQYVETEVDHYLGEMIRRNADGLIMTFRADNPKWSYVRLDSSGWVREVVEKRVVSKQATVGIYNFRTGHDFIDAADLMIERNLRVNNEFYVAPVYNLLIEQGAAIATYDIGSEGHGMHGLGLPEDVKRFVISEISRKAVRRAQLSGSAVSSAE